MKTEVLARAAWPAWDAYLGTLADSQLKQSSAYAEALKLYGWRPEILVASDEGRWLAGALIGVKPIPLIGGCRVLVSGGLAVRDDAPAAAVGGFVRSLEEYARREGAVRLQVGWRRPYSIAGVEQAGGDAARDVLCRSGYEPLEVTGTYRVRLAGRDPGSLLASFGQYTRRYIRRALEERFEFREETSDGALAQFEAAHRELARRKRLTPLPSGFGRVLRASIDAGLARLFVVRVAGRLRNTALISTLGAPFFVMGAVLEGAEGEARLPTGPFLHYSVMCRFLGHAAGYYDFGGSPGPEPLAGHPNFSVWQFKRRFNGDYTYHVGGGCKVLRPTAERMLRVMLALRRGLPGLRRPASPAV